MRCFVESKEVPPSALFWRELNFGGSIAGERTVRYEIALGIDEFLEKYGAEYEKFYVDWMDDEARYGIDASSCPEKDKLRTLGCPALGTLIRQEPGLVEFLIREWETLSVLDVLLSYNPKEMRFVINDVSQARVEGGLVTFGGEAFVRRGER